MSATTVRSNGTRRTVHHRTTPVVVKQHTEADVYAEIVRAWVQMYRYSDRLDHPMQPFVATSDLTYAVRKAANPEQIVTACARILSTEGWLLRDAVPICGKLQFTEALDPISAWWLPLDDKSGLGIHFWRLVNRTIELRTIGRIESSPELRFGRFAEREKRRERASARPRQMVGRLPHHRRS